MSRPKKPARGAQGDLRAFGDGADEWMAQAARQHCIDILRADPHKDEPLAAVLGGIIRGNEPTAWESELLGKLMAQALGKMTIEQAQSFFDRIMALKKNWPHGHRNAFAYYAYSKYIEATGKEPTKKELKKYIVAHRDIFKDAPLKEDTAGWTRLWKNSGLFTLENTARNPSFLPTTKGE